METFIFCLSFTILVLTAIASSQENTDSVTREGNYYSDIESCINQTGVKREYLRSLKPGNNFTLTKEMACYARCILTSRGYMYYNGTFVEKTGESDAIRRCKQQSDEDTCWVAGKAFQCIIENNLNLSIQPEVESCIDQTGVKREYLRSLKPGNNFTLTKEMACYARCILTSRGYMYDNGTFVEKTGESDAVRSCKQQSGSPCEIAGKAFQCFIKNNLNPSIQPEVESCLAKTSVKRELLYGLKVGDDIPLTEEFGRFAECMFINKGYMHPNGTFVNISNESDVMRKCKELSGTEGYETTGKVFACMVKNNLRV